MGGLSAGRNDKDLSLVNVYHIFLGRKFIPKGVAEVGCVASDRFLSLSVSWILVHKLSYFSCTYICKYSLMFSCTY